MVVIGVLIAVIGCVAYVTYRSRSGDHSTRAGASEGPERTVRDDGPDRDHPGAIHRTRGGTDAQGSIDVAGLPVKISGRVIDPKGQPVAGVEVDLMATDRQGGDVVATSAADGVYAAEVTSGTWDVHATGNGVIAAPERLVVPGSPAVTTHDIVVDRAGRIFGHVRSSEGMVAGAVVSSPATSVTATSDAGGAYELLVPVEKADLRAETDDGRVGFAYAMVPPGGEIEINLVILDPAIVTGHVVDARGAAVAGADVTAFSVEAGTKGTQKVAAKSDDRGAFELRVNPGSVDVEARHSGAATSGAQRIQLDVGARTDLTLTLAPEIAFTGIVVDGDGAPVSGAHIKARLDGTHANLVATDTDGDGHFALAGARAGGYQLIATAGDQQVRLHVDVDGTAPVTVTLERSGGIHGIVTLDEADNALAADVTVEIERYVPIDDDHDGHIPLTRQTFPGASGFRLSDLPPGHYDLAVTARGHTTAHVTGVEVKDGAWTDVTVNLAMGAFRDAAPASPVLPTART